MDHSLEVCFLPLNRFVGPAHYGLRLQPDNALFKPALQEQSPAAFNYGDEINGVKFVSGTNAVRRDFSNLNLSNLSLDGSDFREVDFSGANLGGTSFIQSKLDNITAYDANVVNSSIAHSSSQFSNYDQTCWLFSSLANANLRYSTFRDADLRFTNLL